MLVTVSLCLSGGTFSESTIFWRNRSLHIHFQKLCQLFLEYSSKNCLQDCQSCINSTWRRYLDFLDEHFFLNFNKCIKSVRKTLRTILKNMLVQFLKLHSTCPGEHLEEMEFFRQNQCLNKYSRIIGEQKLAFFAKKVWHVFQSWILLVQSTGSTKYKLCGKENLFQCLFAKNEPDFCGLLAKNLFKLAKMAIFLSKVSFRWKLYTSEKIGDCLNAYEQWSGNAF